MKELTLASISSIPYRVSSLEGTLKSIYPQVNYIYVYLNQYDHVPLFLLDKKIKVYLSQEHGDRGDAGKFYPIINKDGYIFTLDDDIVYPFNYVQIMLKKIEEYKRKSFICVHGNILPKRRMRSYYADKISLNFLKKLEKDSFVDVPGTGTLAFHSSIYKFKMEDFKIANMSDIWLHQICLQNNISIVCIKRANLWLKETINEENPNSIYKFFKNNDEVQTKILNDSREF